MKIFGPLYDVAIRWSRHRRAPTLLTGLSFVEGFIFPVPPEVMLAPMSLAEPKRSLWFATLSLLGSVCGALVGYLLGHFAFAALQPLIEWLGWSAKIQQQIETLRTLVADSPWKAFWALVLVGFTPIPLKIFTWHRAWSACRSCRSSPACWWDAASACIWLPVRSAWVVRVPRRRCIAGSSRWAGLRWRCWR